MKITVKHKETEITVEPEASDWSVDKIVNLVSHLVDEGFKYRGPDLKDLKPINPFPLCEDISVDYFRHKHPEQHPDILIGLIDYCTANDIKSVDDYQKSLLCQDSIYKRWIGE